jgi:carbonic anhydrase
VTPEWTLLYYILDQIITDCDPGDIFVVRNVANLVPPYSPDPGHHGTSAALEYAVKVLKVENVIVLGHSHCGGIKALLASQSEGAFEFLESWMSIARKAKEKISRYYQGQPIEKQERACEQASVLQSLDHLVTYPWIADKLEKGNLQIVGWYFDFDTGDLLAYNSETDTFETISEVTSPLRPKGLSISKRLVINEQI